jgi:hypothetical protein
MKTGDYVQVSPRRSEPGDGLSYETFLGRLAENCNGEGWDVVDVVHGATNETISVYSFSVRLL